MSVSPIGGLPTIFPPGYLANAGAAGAAASAAPAPATGYVAVTQSPLAAANQPAGGVQSGYLNTNTPEGRAAAQADI